MLVYKSAILENSTRCFKKDPNFEIGDLKLAENHLNFDLFGALENQKKFTWSPVLSKIELKNFCFKKTNFMWDSTNSKSRNFLGMLIRK